MTQTSQPIQPPRFPLGQVVATPTVLAHFDAHGLQPLEYLSRHAHGDWGDVPPEDAQQNEFAVTRRLRLLSSYTVANKTVWIISEADRSVTTLLFPDEY